MPKNEEDKKPFDKWLENQPEIESPIELSIVIPAYNEQWRLPTTLIETVDYLDSRNSPYEIIVVDDGSQDDTASIVRKFEKFRRQVKLIKLPSNKGKGHAVRIGCLNAKGNYILFADADGSTPIQELEKLKLAIDAGANMAIGSRAAFSDDTKVVTHWYKKFRGRIFNTIVNLLLLPNIKDTQCGFKMFTQETSLYCFQRQTSDGFSFDVEVLVIAKVAGFKISEVPVNWTNVSGSKVNPWLDPIKMLIDIVIYTFKHRASK